MSERSLSTECDCEEVDDLVARGPRPSRELFHAMQVPLTMEDLLGPPISRVILASLGRCLAAPGKGRA